MSNYGAINFPNLTFPTDRNSGLVSPAIGEVSLYADNVEVIECKSTGINFKTPITLDGPIVVANQGSGVDQVSLRRPDGTNDCLELRNESFVGVVNIQTPTVNDSNIVNPSVGGNIFLQTNGGSVNVLPASAGTDATFRVYGKNPNDYQERASIKSSTTRGQYTALAPDMTLPAYSFQGQTNAGMGKVGTDVAIGHTGVAVAQYNNTGVLFNKPITVANQGSGVDQLVLTRPDGTQGCLTARNQDYSLIAGISGGGVNDSVIANFSGGGNIFLRPGGELGILSTPTTAHITRLYGGNAGTFQNQITLEAQTTYGRTIVRPASLDKPAYTFTSDTTVGMSYSAGNTVFTHSGGPVMELNASSIFCYGMLRQQELEIATSTYDMGNSTEFNVFQYTGTVASTWQMALAINCQGSPIYIHNTGTQVVTLNRKGADTFGSAANVSIAIANNVSIVFYARGNNSWFYTILT